MWITNAGKSITDKRPSQNQAHLDLDVLRPANNVSQ